MKITQLKLENIKNHKEYEIAFTEGLNKIEGQSGIGKTTILEAILFMLTTKGLTGTAFTYASEKHVGKAYIGLTVEINSTPILLELKGSAYYVDGFKFNKTTYLARLVELGIKDVEKFINSHYVMNKLHWEEARKLFNDIFSGTINDEDTLLEKGFTSEQYNKAKTVGFNRKLIQTTLSASNKEYEKASTELEYAKNNPPIDTKIINELTETRDKIKNALGLFDANRNNAEVSLFNINMKINEISNQNRERVNIVNTITNYENEKENITKTLIALSTLEKECNVCGSHLTDEQAQKLQDKTKIDSLVNRFQTLEKELVQLRTKEVTQLDNSKLVTEKDNQTKELEVIKHDMSTLNLELNTIITKLGSVDSGSDEINKLTQTRDAKLVVKQANQTLLDLVTTRQEIISTIILMKSKELFTDFEIALEETQNNGTIKPTFDVKYDGISYKHLNTGRKLQIGLQLAMGLQKAHGVSFPILIDGLESNPTIETYGYTIIGAKTI